jgi:hypothetical protein
MNTRAIIDYAIKDDAAAMRDALYSEIQDRVHAHLEMKKQEIAGNLIAQEDAVDISDNESVEEPQE